MDIAVGREENSGAAKGDQTETLELPQPTAPNGSAPVVSTLPPFRAPPPQSGLPAAANAPASLGCMPEPVGC
jgi:hypothetical protein